MPRVVWKRLVMPNQRRSTAALVGFALLVLAATLAGCGQDTPSQAGNRPNETTPGPTEVAERLTSTPTPGIQSAVDSVSPGEPLSAEFLRGTEVGQAILAYLGCIDFDCVEASEAVVAIGPDAVAPLTQILQNGVAPEVAAELTGDVPTLIRLRAAHALGELRDDRAEEPLITLLQDKCPLLRAEAVAALAKIGAEEALDYLLPLLNDPDPLVREMTAQALAELGRPEALPALRDAVETEPEEYMRSAIEMAIQALERR